MDSRTMTQEQKAKAYDEALNWMRELYPGLHGATKEDAENYFPELKESKENEDEKIIQFFAELATNACGGPGQEYYEEFGLNYDKVMAWLEKQKAVKTPQWMIDFLNDIRTASINKEGYDDYDGRREYEGKILAIIRWLEGNFIQQKEQKTVIVKHHNGDENNPYDMGASEAQDYIIKRGFSIPFTDGEVYVDERHIIQTIGNILKWADEHPKEQKPVTINQDEKEFLADEITAFLCNYDKEFDDDPVPSEVAEHFYLLGKQAQEQKPVEWSEEDEKMRITILNALTTHLVYSAGKGTYTGAASTYRYTYRYGDEIAWLKSLPKRFNLQPQAKQEQKEPSDKGEISDGYHTFNGLYYYRLFYNAAFFNLLPKEWVHKSKRHHDGEECFGGGWFIVTANLPTGQISNHYEIKDWDLFHIPEKETADRWDGHTPQEAAERLHKFLLEMPDLMPVEYLPKEKVYDIIAKLTNLSYSNLIPFNSEEYKKINEITSEVFDLLKYPVEKK